MTYKIGDKVRIKADLKCKTYAKCLVVPMMLEYKGNEYTIRNVIPRTYSSTLYTLNGTGIWSFTEEMFVNRPWKEVLEEAD